VGGAGSREVENKKNTENELDDLVLTAVPTGRRSGRDYWTKLGATEEENKKTSKTNLMIWRFGVTPPGRGVGAFDRVGRPFPIRKVAERLSNLRKSRKPHDGLCVTPNIVR
jgi:hypothetical protein